MTNMLSGQRYEMFGQTTSSLLESYDAVKCSIPIKKRTSALQIKYYAEYNLKYPETRETRAVIIKILKTMNTESQMT